MDHTCWKRFEGKTVLLLQGPVGPFFRRLSRALRHAGARDVVKINFNGGDFLFHPDAQLNFRGSTEEWGNTLRDFATRRKVDAIVLFGDCRAIHVVAREVADKLNLETWVFEEGYIRPDFITFEQHGVNANSRLPRNAEFYRRRPRSSRATLPIGSTFWYAALWAVLYYTAGHVGRLVFPASLHHRKLSIFESLNWIRGTWRKLYYRAMERRELSKLLRENAPPYYLLALQVCRDFQVRKHSGYDSVEASIRAVVASFAVNAPSAAVLAIKHHPLDRGYHDYARLIRELAETSQLNSRLVYLHDQYLPTLLSRARGVVVINSTVGLSALQHGVPVKALGNALYDLPGLCFQGTLDQFWTRGWSAEPERALLERFLGYLIEHTQINGSFYKNDPSFIAACGGEIGAGADSQNSPPVPSGGQGLAPAAPEQRFARPEGGFTTSALQIPAAACAVEPRKLA